MYAISLTSIPPRLPHIGPVLASLLAQRPAPVAVYLCLPRIWRRFTASALEYEPPAGVELLRTDHDLGPAGKALPAARQITGTLPHLIYCDDDWIYPQGWAARLLAAKNPGQATAATGFDITRLKRLATRPRPGPGYTDIAQGFSGVLIEPAWLAHTEADPPTAAWSVDDIWLSGQFARQGIPIRLAPDARIGLRPAFRDEHGLQDQIIDGSTRHTANLACADLLTERYNLWPRALPSNLRPLDLSGP